MVQKCRTRLRHRFHYVVLFKPLTKTAVDDKVFKHGFSRKCKNKGNRILQVAVIGCGAAGLCAAKHLSAEPEKFNFTVFEQQNDCGGTWKYSADVGTDEYNLPIHSSMYKNLRSNLPKETMAFPDFPFSECEGKSFIHHTDVLQYLKDYAKHYNLYDYVKFHTVIESVEPINPDNPDPKWRVRYRNLINNNEIEDVYDAVMACNGHYSVPRIPELPGIENYEGLLIHSHNYRNNSQFTNKRVVVLGAGASGIDIALEIAQVASEVVLSHNLARRTCPLPPNLLQDDGIEKFHKNCVTFLNKNEYVCDAVVLCTGYLYRYTFLEGECALTIGDQHLKPLFKHLFHTLFPTLGIWAVPKQILPFPIFNQQVLVFLRFLKGEISLPNRETMDLDSQEDFEQRLKSGMKPRHAHTMPGKLQWLYDDQLSELGGIPPVPNSVRNLYRHVHSTRKQNVLKYKDQNYRIIDEESFVETV